MKGCIRKGARKDGLTERMKERRLNTSINDCMNA